MPTIYPRSSRKMVGTLRFAHPTGLRLICLSRNRKFRAGLRQINTTSKSLLIFRNHVKPSPQKYSASASTQISRITPPSHPMRGALANVTNARWDAVDAEGASDVRAGGVR